MPQIAKQVADTEREDDHAEIAYGRMDGAARGETREDAKESGARSEDVVMRPLVVCRSHLYAPMYGRTPNLNCNIK